MAALARAKPLEGDELPDREPRRPGLTKDGALVSDLLKLLLKIRAKESGVAPRLIARSDELEALAAGVRKDLEDPAAAGGSRNSAATRSTWSRAGSASRSRTASSR